MCGQACFRLTTLKAFSSPGLGSFVLDERSCATGAEYLMACHGTHRAYRAYKSVTAKVQEGMVTLEGQVAWNYQRDAAERAIRYLRALSRFTIPLHSIPKPPRRK